MTPADGETLGSRVEAAERRYRLTNRVIALAILSMAAYFGLGRMGADGIVLIVGSTTLGLMGLLALSVLMGLKKT